MHPTETTYHLVTNKTERKACLALYEAAEPTSPKIKLGFPTVYALRQGVLLGFLGSIPVKGRIVAGPLVLDPTMKRPVITAMRLCEAYEEILKAAGVQFYTLAVDNSKPEWARTLERSGFELYRQTPKLFCYKRQVP